MNLREKVQQGTFREDLYFRLRVIDIILPALRERTGDVELLVNVFIQRFTKKMNKSITGISDQAMALLSQYQWPGNIRELEHVIERSCVLCNGSTISTEQLPLEIQNANTHPVPPNPILQKKTGSQPDTSISVSTPSQYHSFENDIIATLKKTGGNKAKAARMLSMDRSTLYRKLKELNIDIKSLDI